MFVAVFLLRLASSTTTDAYSLFYVLPVALAAITFGRRAGVGAALLAVALIAVWTIVQDVTLSPLAWATRVIPIVLLGVLLGDAVERARRAEAARQRLELAAVLQREAIEINDTLIQQVAAAKWSLEAGEHDACLQMLTVTLSDAQKLVSSLIKRAGMDPASGLSHRAQSAAPPEQDWRKRA
jgi:hypothetical protein